jgi:hypothetical protein
VRPPTSTASQTSRTLRTSRSLLAASCASSCWNPSQATFGRLAIRSAYRAPAVNEFGNRHGLSCASNLPNYGRHIWDRRDAEGAIGAMATIVVPWFADRYRDGADWRALAWWIHDHLPYSQLLFFPKLAAFNIGWHERPRRRIDSFIAPRGCLTRPGMANHRGSHAELYSGFPGCEPVKHRGTGRQRPVALTIVEITRWSDASLGRTPIGFYMGRFAKLAACLRPRGRRRRGKNRPPPAIRRGVEAYRIDRFGSVDGIVLRSNEDLGPGLGRS